MSRDLKIPYEWFESEEAKKTMTTCQYCGIERPFPCRNTSDMANRPGSKKCFAALMILGGGERPKNQAKAVSFRRLANDAFFDSNRVDFTMEAKTK